MIPCDLAFLPRATNTICSCCADSRPTARAWQRTVVEFTHLLESYDLNGYTIKSCLHSSRIQYSQVLEFAPLSWNLAFLPDTPSWSNAVLKPTSRAGGWQSTCLARDSGPNCTLNSHNCWYPSFQSVPLVPPVETNTLELSNALLCHGTWLYFLI